MIIANFTPDNVEYVHGGIPGVLKSGDVKEVNDAKGNHILNMWGDRGLIRLQYTEEEGYKEKMQKEAMKIWTRFWERQIVVFNRHNETLENENKAYVSPPDHIREHAERLGISLVGPWKLKPTQDAEVERIQRENADLKKDVEELKTNLKDMIELIKEERNLKVTEKQSYLRQFVNRSKSNYRAWVNTNAEMVAEWPAEILEEVRIKWINHYKDTSELPDVIKEALERPKE